MPTAIDVAKWFVNNTDRESGDAITHLKLQKLIYYAQAWHMLALERPLFDEEIQAWAHGPVVPSVYHQFKGYVWEAIPTCDSNYSFDAESEEILQQVSDIYGEFSAKRLEAMTHKEDPWLAARGDLPPEARCDSILPKEHIREYFAQTYGEMLDESETT